MSVTTDHVFGAKHGIVVLGPAPQVPSPMVLVEDREEGHSRMKGVLAVSVRRLGVVEERWTPEVVLRTSPSYLGAICRLTRKAGINVPDWRYLIADEDKLEVLKQTIQLLYREKVPTAEQSASVVAFCRKMKGNLVALGDDQQVN